MKKIHKLLIGLFVAAAVAILVGILVMALQANNASADPTNGIIRIATDPTNTPSRSPCHGSGC